MAWLARSCVLQASSAMTNSPAAATDSLQNRRALVTGASAGIGAAFARALAKQGAALVLTARRADRLGALAAELRAAYGINVDTIAADLADRAVPAELCDELERRGLPIDILINNAGYGVTGNLLAQPWQVHADFLQVMLNAPTEFAYRLLPAMRDRGYGRIVNVASLAGHLPAPAGHTLYAAVKAYLIRFSQALALENGNAGVNVCALCPGFTYSEFHDVNGARPLVSKMPRWLWMDADRVAREGLAAVERGDPVYVNGRINRLIKAFVTSLPDTLATHLVARRGKEFRVSDSRLGDNTGTSRRPD
jgi:short-subunit dehydrogenase